MLTYFTVVIGIHATFVVFGPHIARTLTAPKAHAQTRTERRLQKLQRLIESVEDDELRSGFEATASSIRDDAQEASSLLPLLEAGWISMFVLRVTGAMLWWMTAGLAVAAGDVTEQWIGSAVGLVLAAAALTSDWHIWAEATKAVRDQMDESKALADRQDD